MAFPTVLLTFFTYCAIAFAELKSNYNERGWSDAGKYLTQFMDRSASPCNSFHQFVCGNYSVIDDDTYQEYTRLRSRDLAQTAQDAIEHIDVNNDRTPEYARVVRRFYDDCSHSEDDQSTIRQAYDSLRNTLGQFPAFDAGESNEANIWYTMGQMRQKLGVEFALDIKFVGPFESISAIVPYTNFSFDGFRNQTIQAAKKLGKDLDLNRLDQLLQEAESFYDDWKAVNKSNNFLLTFRTQMIEKSFFVTLENLPSQIPNVDWSSFFRGLLPSDIYDMERWNSAHVAIDGSETINEIGTVFARHPKRAAIMLMYGKAFRQLLSTWTTGFESTIAVQLEMRARIELTRPRRCLAYILEYMSAPAARVYFDYIGISPMHWREEIITLATNVFSAMRMLLNSISFISPASKEKINRKIDAIDVFPTLPSWIMNDTKILEDVESYSFRSNSTLFMKKIENDQRKFEKDVQSWYSFDDVLLQVLDDSSNRSSTDEPHEKKQKDKFVMANPENPMMLVACLAAPFQYSGSPCIYNRGDKPPSFEINSCFSACFLGLNAFLGYSLPPIFHPSYPLAVKYGAEGFVIGHELMHGLDAGGIKIAGPDDKKLLEDNEYDVYQKHVSCLIQSYDQYCYKKLGACVQSEVAIRDNIADIGGIKAAYAAYQMVKDVEAKEPPIPGLEQFTNDQVFFIAVQRQLCTRNLPSLKNVKEDHTTDEARATLALRNSPHFAAAFKCAVGSPAAPVRSCEFWGDIYGMEWNTNDSVKGCYGFIVAVEGNIGER